MTIELTQFKKGMTPWNKGTRGVMKTNSGTFQKGQKPFHVSPSEIKSCGVCSTSFNVKSYLTKVRTCSVKCGQILRFREKKHPRWIEDRSKLQRISKHGERRTSAYFYWRKTVWLRDGHNCKIANPDCLGRIEAHHILSWSDYPELRYEVNNGITLCHAHHPRVRAEVKRLIPTFLELVSVSK